MKKVASSFVFMYSSSHINPCTANWFSCFVSCFAEFFRYRVVFLVVGIVMLSLASAMSKSLVFYYSSAMAIGIILVILMVLFQVIQFSPSYIDGLDPVYDF